MLDVITDLIYPARISVEGGFFKEIVPIVINDDSELDISGIIFPVWPKLPHPHLSHLENSSFHQVQQLHLF